MSGWKEYKLGNVIETNRKSIGSNYPHSKILYLDTGSITCNRIESLQEFDLKNSPSRAKRLVDADDIIYSSVRPNQLHYGFIKEPKDNLVVSTGFVTITCNKEMIDPVFLFYNLTQSQTTEYLHSIAEASTSAYPSLKPSDIESLEILLPPLPEQTAIAEVLSSLDDKIGLLHRQNKSLEQLAETLFRQWFMEEAKESWEEKGLDEIAQFLNGLACQKYPRKSGEIGLPVIKIKEMRTGITESSDWVTADIPEKYVIRNGDMLFSWSGSLDIVLWFGGKGVLNQHLFKVSSEKYPQWFYYFWTQYHLQEFKGIAEDKATTMGHIQRHHLSNSRVIVPTSEELQVMDETVNPIFQKIKSNTIQIKTLTQLRDTLLPKLMSGEVRVSD